MKNGTGNRMFSSVLFSLGLFGTRQRATYFSKLYTNSNWESAFLITVQISPVWAKCQNILNPSRFDMHTLSLRRAGNFVLTKDEPKPSSWLTLLLLQCTMSVGFLVQTNLNLCNDKDFSGWNKISVPRNANAGDVNDNDFSRWNKISIPRNANTGNVRISVGETKIDYIDLKKATKETCHSVN